MPPSTKPFTFSRSDPRTYIKPLPLPISSQKGVKIQARSDKHFNPTIPPRDVLRQENYTRRQHQLQNQGFRCAPNKPYEGLGDPFYLDHKKLILHALGQWEEGQELETSSSSESEEESHNVPEEVKKQKIPANFVLRRSRKGLNTLSKEVGHARNLIRNVRLGHGLFQLLRKEREDKTNARHREEMKQRQQQLNEWQPPSYNSSTDNETDDDLDEDVDLRNYMLSTTTLHVTGAESEFPQSEIKSAYSGSPAPAHNMEGQADQSKSRVAFQGVENHPTAVSEFARSQYTQSVRSRMSRGSSRKKLPPGRPYTPQHSYIGSEVTDLPDNFDGENSDLVSSVTSRDALFRQLCCLFWLLEAMNVEAPVAMGPILTCWELREIGGSKTTLSKQQLEKKSEIRWKQFLTNQVLRGVDGYYNFDTRRKPKLRAPSFNCGRDLSSPSQGEGRGPRGLKTIAQVLGRWPGLGGKRPSVWRLGGKVRGRGNATGRNSVASIASLTESQTAADQGSARGQRACDSAIPEGSGVSHGQEMGTDVTEDEEARSKGPLRYLDEYYSSASVERDQSNIDTMSQEVLSARSDRSSTLSPVVSHQLPRRKERRPMSGVDSSVPRKSLSPMNMKKTTVPVATETMPTQEEILKFLESINRSEEDPRFHALANPKEKMSSKYLRADLNVRPRSTPAVLEYQASLPSNRVGALAREQRQKFVEVTEEKALMMHDALEAKGRQRLRVLQKKFLHMPTGGCSFHRALGKMRSQSADDEEMRERRRHSTTTHQAWYIEMLQNIPEEVKHDWSFCIILEKLAKYGLVDSSKQSAYKLLKVLSSLRDWEICSPDICAAIEFCRDKICEMSIDEYEEWFRSQFPTVLRPQTAPAATRNGKDKPSGCLKTENPKTPHSAPPGGTRNKVAF